MKKSNITSSLIYLPIFALVMAVTFVLFYLTTYVWGLEALIYVNGIISQFVSASYPLLVAVILTVFEARERKSPAFLIAIPYALTYILYTAPQSYLEGFYSGYSTGDAVVYALISSLIYVTAVYLEIILLFLFITFAIKRLSGVKRAESYSLLGEINENKPFDFSRPVTVALFGASGIRFVYNLFIELIDTVRFLISYAHSFTFTEALYMILSYVSILLTLVLSYLLAFRFKQHLTEKEA